MYYFTKNIFLLFIFLSLLEINSQNQIVSYSGGSCSKTFNDALQLPNVHFIVAGSADNMNWIPKSASIIILPNLGIVNVYGTPTAFLMESTLQNILKVYSLL